MKTFSTFVNSLVLVSALGLVTLQPSLAKTNSADKSAKTSSKAKASSKSSSKSSAKADAKSDAKAEDADKEKAAAKAPEVDPVLEQKTTVKNLEASLESLDAKLVELEDISTSSTSMLNSRRNRIESTISRVSDEIEELAEIYKELKAMQDEPYEFTITSDEERFAYTTKGEAEYKEIMKLMKAKSLFQKTQGLNKFDAFSQEYRGITDYAVAAELYSKIVHLLNKRWLEAYGEATAKQDRLSESRKEEAEDEERKAFIEYGKKGKEKGIDINQDWFNPLPTNTKMLRILTLKAKRFIDDEAKRMEDFAEDEDEAGVGALSPMIVEFWEKMEATRKLMQEGKYEEADKAIKEDELFATMSKLNRKVCPEEYTEGFREEVRGLESEIRRRQNEQRGFENSISRKNNLITRDCEYATSQADAVMGEIEKALDQARAEAGDKKSEK